MIIDELTYQDGKRKIFNNMKTKEFWLELKKSDYDEFNKIYKIILDVFVEDKRINGKKPVCKLCGAKVPVSKERTYEICTRCILEYIQRDLERPSTSSYWIDVLKKSASIEWIFHQLEKE